MKAESLTTNGRESLESFPRGQVLEGSAVFNSLLHPKLFLCQSSVVWFVCLLVFSFNCPL